MMYKPETEWLLRPDIESIGAFALCERELEDKRREKEGTALASLRKGAARNLQNESRRRAMAPIVGLGISEHSGIITECGKFLEIWIPENPVRMGECAERQVNNKPKQEAQEDMARRVNHRARKQIRRLVNTNNLRAMITLTLAPPSPANDRKYKTIPIEEQRDYDEVRRILHNYQCKLRKRIKADNNKMRRLRRDLGGCNPRYVAVLELHDSERTSALKRGTWHIHLAVECNSDLISLMRRTWRHGLTDCQDYRYDKHGKLRDAEISNPGAYIAEYIGKGGAQFGRADLRDKKRYTTSRGIRRPVKVLMGGGEIEGDIEVITYKGKRYVNKYYNMKCVPGTSLFGVIAHYQEVER